MPLSSTGPLDVYEAKIAAGELKRDPAQLHAVLRLEGLHRALIGYRPSEGWLGRFSAFFQNTAPRGIYLHGGVGRGKSMLMDLFIAEAPVERKRRVHFHAFMLEVHARLHKWRQKAPTEREGKDPIPPLARKLGDEAWLLCFDEFQVTNIADAMILARLLQGLFDRGVVMVATSNTAPDDLYAGGLQRAQFEPAIALIKQRLDIVPVDGVRDYRRDLIHGMPVYYTPLGSAATAALDAAFAKLTGEARAAPADIAVLGRTLTLARTAKGVAMATFFELCEQPLGAADYLAIAAGFHTLILDGVRVLAPEERDPARRFVNLVDVLYERRTRLICAAAAPPDMLYPAGDLAAEFRRAASRLDEMRSQTYLMSGPLAAAHKSG